MENLQAIFNHGEMVRLFTEESLRFTEESLRNHNMMIQDIKISDVEVNNELQETEEEIDRIAREIREARERFDSMSLEFERKIKERENSTFKTFKEEMEETGDSFKERFEATQRRIAEAHARMGR